MGGAPLAELLSDYSLFCVGSLPFSDAARAAQFVLSHPRILPFWPELPGRPAELSLNRAERSLAPGWSGYLRSEAGGLYALAEALRAMSYRPQVIKCQLLGPLTFALHARGLPGGFEERLNIALERCARQIEWQQAFLGPSADRLLFVADEPGFAAWNGIKERERALVREAYSYLYVRVAELPGFLGMHCCAAFQPALLGLALDLLSFDAWDGPAEKIFAPDLRPLWREALDRGLTAVPGVFPALCRDDFRQARQRGEEIHQRILGIFADLNPGRDAPSMCSAACGHAGASVEWVEFLYRETR